MYHTNSAPNYEDAARRAKAQSKIRKTKRIKDVHVKEHMQELREQNFKQRNKESIV